MIILSLAPTITGGAVLVVLLYVLVVLVEGVKKGTVMFAAAIGYLSGVLLAALTLTMMFSGQWPWDMDF